MKTNVYILLIILGFFILSCAQDQKDTVAVNTDSTSTSNNNSTISNSSVDTIDTNKQNDSKNQASDNKSKIEKAQDIDNQISTKINKNSNPDNLNGNYNPSDENSNITFIPILSEEDKACYFVQILESPKKLNRQYFDTYFKSKQDVYVAVEGEVYNYCIGKFKNEEDAIKYLKEVKAKFKFKKCMVKSYSAGW